MRAQSQVPLQVAKFNGQNGQQALDLARLTVLLMSGGSLQSLLMMRGQSPLQSV
jgi:hypothetical protein